MATSVEGETLLANFSPIWHSSVNDATLRPLLPVKTSASGSFADNMTEEYWRSCRSPCRVQNDVHYCGGPYVSDDFSNNETESSGFCFSSLNNEGNRNENAVILERNGSLDLAMDDVDPGKEASVSYCKKVLDGSEGCPGSPRSMGDASEPCSCGDHSQAGDNDWIMEAVNEPATARGSIHLKLDLASVVREWFASFQEKPVVRMGKNWRLSHPSELNLPDPIKTLCESFDFQEGAPPLGPNVPCGPLGVAAVNWRPTLVTSTSLLQGSDYAFMGNTQIPPRVSEQGLRAACLERYREKKRNRGSSQRVRYEMRRLNAEKRPRIKGRFVKRPMDDFVMDDFCTIEPESPVSCLHSHSNSNESCSSFI
eukprot:jgi/Botrbrau1/9110/Bobra.0305s0015.1